ncbi:hypothetical protein CCACVL1_09651 [Corchorus capsularis]|uniref:Uncharacterized protein n=1 Tax=Corchorus capsularis TaxID=210143 RepID=A0A1R3IUR2_COCAP|nr:hypothetical protein CCACVL1_09651 [Corchorus capsularis]
MVVSHSLFVVVVVRFGKQDLAFLRGLRKL